MMQCSPTLLSYLAEARRQEDLSPRRTRPSHAGRQSPLSVFVRALSQRSVAVARRRFAHAAQLHGQR